MQMFFLKLLIDFYLILCIWLAKSAEGSLWSCFFRKKQQMIIVNNPTTMMARLITIVNIITDLCLCVSSIFSELSLLFSEKSSMSSIGTFSELTVTRTSQRLKKWDLDHGRSQNVECS